MKQSLIWPLKVVSRGLDLLPNKQIVDLLNRDSIPQIKRSKTALCKVVAYRIFHKGQYSCVE